MRWSILLTAVTLVLGCDPDAESLPEKTERGDRVVGKADGDLAPADWDCAPAYYGSNDGCDCGCGAFDPDCDDASVDACHFEWCGDEDVNEAQNWSCGEPVQTTIRLNQGSCSDYAFYTLGSAPLVTEEAGSLIYRDSAGSENTIDLFVRDDDIQVHHGRNTIRFETGPEVFRPCASPFTSHSKISFYREFGRPACDRYPSITVICE